MPFDINGQETVQITVGQVEFGLPLDDAVFKMPSRQAIRASKRWQTGIRTLVTAPARRDS